MRHLKMIAAVALLGLTAPAVAQDKSEVLTNDSILMLHQSGFGDEVIIAKIKQGDTDFQVEMSDLTALKNAGISSQVMAAMIEAREKETTATEIAIDNESPDPLVQHDKGLYLLIDQQNDPKMLAIEPTLSDQTKTGGMFGYLLTAGIASMSFKSVISDEHARVQSTNSQPVFYLFFDKSIHRQNDNGDNLWTAGGAASVSNPSEFSLIELKVKKERREAKVGSFNIAGAKSGVMDKDRIAFEHEEIRPGVYKVWPSQPLEAGEYAFLYPVSVGSGVGASSGGAMSARIFDFGIAKE